MKNLPCMALAALMGQALAAPEPVYLGRSDCRIAALETVPAGASLHWSGACDSGYAHGKGVLTWTARKQPGSLSGTLVRGEVSGEAELKTKDYAYTGTLRRGLPHGSGYMLFPNGTQYEGSFADGKFDGKGTLLHYDQSEYKGEWKGHKRNGWGEATFNLGGSYAGQWKDGEPHGRGVMTFAGSGRKFDGEFEQGRPAGTGGATPKTTKVKLELRDDTVATVSVPPDDNWQTLNEGYKESIRSAYLALAPGDEPPYPLKGMRRTLEAVMKLNSEAGSADGTLLIYVTIGVDGRAKDAKIVKKPTLPNPDDAERLAKYVAGVMMLDEYKPALCQGRPCDMVYPGSFSFSADFSSGVSASMFR